MGYAPISYAAFTAPCRATIIFFNSGTHDPQFVPHLSFPCSDASIASDDP